MLLRQGLSYMNGLGIALIGITSSRARWPWSPFRSRAAPLAR